MRLLILLLLPATAQAIDWYDPGMGCGRAANFAKTGKAVDLPGCTGKLPKDAPQVEGQLRETKQILVEAEERVTKDKLDKVDALLAEATQKLSKTPPVHPELPDRWEQALPLYQQTIASLQNRMLLSPHLSKLKAAHDAAVAAKPRNVVATEGGPAEALKAAAACVSAFDPVRKLDLTADGMAGWLKECEELKKSAEPLIKAQEKAAKAKRAKLRATLKGDRRKVFDEHPEALPEFAGADIWKYGGKTYTFKKNKLVSSK